MNAFTEPMELLAIADDLTGALEVGAQFSDENISCVVSTGDVCGNVSRLVIDAGTRRLDDCAAALRIHDIIHTSSVDVPISHVFLKTDSTLRGPIGRSIQAILNEYPDRKVVYAPAYPALGRIVRDGRLFIDGALVTETAFAQDLLNPVRESSPLRLISAVVARGVLRATPRELTQALRTGVVVVVDGETDHDLEITALETCNAGAIAAGTAAFARAWARMLNLPRSPRPPAPVARSGLIVAGSLHPRSWAQVKYAAQRGVPAFATGAGVRVIVRAIEQRNWAIIATSDQVCGEPLQIAAELGRAVQEIATRARFDALVIFGGDTASAVLKALGCTVVRPIQELLTGVPVSMPCNGCSQILVSKAGGFGQEDVIEQIIMRLEGRR
jgi:uncharacterized protein YgbK (DUF1537 family)